ncbi:uncharacterized protein TNIN_138431 [Trichonephila inaurata madagascariensis]|uniref:Uncharacterized protein n=1 Tax=Trichonephila inaurata madagascariensis TaxID=2747483 RepID=A0A8X6X4G4_9ARAC|nr:uncharacterized protein TNIN_138431 [Trichonephila inaurata madagascariensis]
MLTRYSSCISLFADGSRSNSIGSSALKRSILSQLTSQDKGVGLTGIPSPPNLPNLQATSFDYRLERLLEEPRPDSRISPQYRSSNEKQTLRPAQRHPLPFNLAITLPSPCTTKVTRNIDKLEGY